MSRKQSLIDGLSNQKCLPIGVVERETGIARDTLRIWERRYGFPAPVRNNRSERLYPESQIKRLHRIRRLMDQGLRPGKLVPLNETDLLKIEAEHVSITPLKQQENVTALIACLRRHDAVNFDALLEQILAAQGLRIFVLETVAPLLKCVGASWARGEIDVFEEHFMSQSLTRFLSAQIVKQETASSPAPVLLATLPGEQHGLGLLMAATLLADEKVSSVNLGIEVPLDQLVRAVEKFSPTVLGLTFSAAYPYTSVRSNLQELRERLPATTQIWAGGHAMQRIRKLPNGVVKIKSLQELPVAAIP